MGYEYHPNARTTVEIRREIKECNLIAKEAAKKFNVHMNTIYKWRHRDESALKDRSHATGVTSYTLSEFERYLICEVKKVTLFSLDDLLEVLKPFIPNLNRGNLYTTLKQEGLNRNDLILPDKDKKEGKYKKFKNYEPGYIHIDVKYLPKVDGEQKYLFVAIDRKTRLVHVNIYADKSADSAEKFVNDLIEFYPYRINKILTDNGKEFTDRFRKNGDGKPTGNHKFDIKCVEHDIEHRLTKPYTPRTNGMVERFNRRIVENVLNKFVFKNYKELETTIYEYEYTYNRFIKQKQLDYLSPVDYIKTNYSDKLNKKHIDKLYNQAKYNTFSIFASCV